MGLAMQGKESSARMGTLQRLLSFAAMPMCHQQRPARVLLWDDWGSVWCEKGLWDVSVLLGVSLRAGTGSQRCVLCLLSVIHDCWSTCPAGYLRSEKSLVGELCPLSEKSCAWDAALVNMGLGLGTPTLHNSNSSTLSAALLKKSFPRHFHSAPALPSSPATASWKHRGYNTWKNNDGLKITRAFVSFKGI